MFENVDNVLGGVHLLAHHLISSSFNDMKYAPNTVLTGYAVTDHRLLTYPVTEYRSPITDHRHTGSYGNLSSSGNLT